MVSAAALSFLRRFSGSISIASTPRSNINCTSVISSKAEIFRLSSARITGIAAADFSRIRKTKLDRFTIDRLMTILARLDQDVDVQVTVRSHCAESDNRPHVF